MKKKIQIRPFGILLLGQKQQKGKKNANTYVCIHTHTEFKVLRILL